MQDPSPNLWRVVQRCPASPATYSNSVRLAHHSREPCLGRGANVAYDATAACPLPVSGRIPSIVVNREVPPTDKPNRNRVGDRGSEDAWKVTE